MSARIIDGKRIAEVVRAEVKQEAEAFTARTGIRPRIVFLLVGENPASMVYVRNKGKAAEDAGFSHETKSFPATISEQALLDQISALNADRATHAMLCQLPLPKLLPVWRLEIPGIGHVSEFLYFHERSGVASA